MVNFEIGEASAHLASPIIAVQSLFAELVVGTGREANTRSFLYAPQAAFPSFAGAQPHARKTAQDLFETALAGATRGNSVREYFAVAPVICDERSNQ
jgi:hypothetical protein